MTNIYLFEYWYLQESIIQQLFYTLIPFQVLFQYYRNHNTIFQENYIYFVLRILFSFYHVLFVLQMLAYFYEILLYIFRVEDLDIL